MAAPGGPNPPVKREDSDTTMREFAQFLQQQGDPAIGDDVFGNTSMDMLPVPTVARLPSDEHLLPPVSRAPTTGTMNMDSGLAMGTIPMDVISGPVAGVQARPRKRRRPLDDDGDAAVAATATTTTAAAATGAAPMQMAPSSFPAPALMHQPLSSGWLPDVGGIQHPEEDTEVPMIPGPEKQKRSSTRDSAGTPTTTATSTSASSGRRKRCRERRKRVKSDRLEVSFQWELCGVDGLLDDVELFTDSELPVPNFRMHVSLDKGLVFSNFDDAWVTYRKNHMHLVVEVSNNAPPYSADNPRLAVCDPGSSSFFVRRDGVVHLAHIDNLCVVLEGLTYESRPAPGPRELIEPIPASLTAPLFQQLGASRAKKDQQPPAVTPVGDGRVTFRRLHFSSATSYNARKDGRPNPKQQYGCIRVTLQVTTDDGEVIPLMRRVSDPVIVRGGNPKLYSSTTDKEQPIDASANVTASSSRPPGDLHMAASATPSPFLHSQSTSRAGSYPSEGTAEPMLGSYTDSASRHASPMERTPGFTPGFTENSIVTANDGEVRVGINTTVPDEALVVHGNVRVTGNIYQPSDRRIKENFEAVDPADSLARVKQLQIYDYDLRDEWMEASGRTHKHERGVIAQDVAAVMPHAVTRVARADLADGSHVDNLLVVDKNAILMETVGATHALAHNLDDVEQRMHAYHEHDQHHMEEIKGMVRSPVRVSVTHRWDVISHRKLWFIGVAASFVILVILIVVMVKEGHSSSSHAQPRH